jgi:hypothetical protein
MIYNNNNMDIKLEINGKLHKLMSERKSCTECSLSDFCSTICGICPAIILKGGHFVELKMEK